MLIDDLKAIKKCIETTPHMPLDQSSRSKSASRNHLFTLSTFQERCIGQLYYLINTATDDSSAPYLADARCRSQLLAQLASLAIIGKTFLNILKFEEAFAENLDKIFRQCYEQGKFFLSGSRAYSAIPAGEQFQYLDCLSDHRVTFTPSPDSIESGNFSATGGNQARYAHGLLQGNTQIINIYTALSTAPASATAQAASSTSSIITPATALQRVSTVSSARQQQPQ